jgi:hypothetical protein
MGGGITLGHFLIGFAIVDPIVMLWTARRIGRDPETTADRKRGMRYVVAAAFALSIALVLFALFLPEARMRLI